MEGMLSIRHMELSYQRLTLGFYDNGRIEEQQLLEGENLDELADRLMTLPGGRMLSDEAETPFDAIRKTVGEGTALFVIYEEIQVKFSEASFQWGAGAEDSRSADGEESFLRKIMTLFDQLRTKTPGPEEQLKRKLEDLVEEAFDDGRGKIEDLGDVNENVQRLIDRMFKEVNRLIEQHFSTPPEAAIA